MNRAITVGCVALLLVSACTGSGGPAADDAREFPLPEGDEGKTDVFGRKLAGIAAPYAADATLGRAEVEETLRTDHRRRRETAWQILSRVLDPVPLVGLADSAGVHEEIRLPDGEVPRVPRFQTWYGVDEIRRMFRYAYERLGEDGRRRRAPLPDSLLEETLAWNATELDRSSRWPLDRYLRFVDDLGTCPEGLSGDECARLRQSRFSGSVFGVARIVYAPSTVRHLLRSYARIVDCLGTRDTLALEARPVDEGNFTACLASEMPTDAVLVKAQWVRADLTPRMAAFDTDASAVARMMAEGSSADWGMDGDRQVEPAPGRSYEIRLRDGSLYRLAGLHVMTKELRHWTWVSMWWSDLPDADFGADRPQSLASLDGVWAHYKMCAATAYDEGDPDPAARFEDMPTLAEALRASGATTGAPSWCSNPYVEHGRGNARTNCIGCHQHGGASVAHDLDADGRLDVLDLERLIDDEAHFPDNGRRRIRDVFPADYLWSYARVDDFAHVIADEVAYFERADAVAVDARVDRILAMDGDAAAGAVTFASRCARCHGDEGRGTERAPSLLERVAARDDRSIVRTLLVGRGAMPAWGQMLSDGDIAAIRAHLRATFGGGP
ncbi:MAG: cytochrome c [Deltaproteobacteria bacterium]|nr:cytochrome c [Deltaproteobacteria bacterium]